jgi:calcineurin-like phosphoesterase family protein
MPLLNHEISPLHLSKHYVIKIIWPFLCQQSMLSGCQLTRYARPPDTPLMPPGIGHRPACIDGFVDMKTWFTSDSHFGHSRIISLCSRPFADVAEMDRALVVNWNAIVQPTDIVYHLGDFAYRNNRDGGSYLNSLNGIKHLVHGNHDNHVTKGLSGWASSQQMAVIKVDGIQITLLHYAMRTWPSSHHGALHLYGHSHGNLPGDRQSCDVGVDCWDFRPVRLEEIQARLLTLPERHGRRGGGT